LTAPGGSAKTARVRTEITMSNEPSDADPTSETRPVIDYQRPGSGPAATDSIPIPREGKHVPDDLFPPDCCNCLSPTTEQWRAVYGLAVPMCRRCRKRWGVILAALAVAPALAGAGWFGWMWIHD